MKALFIGGTGLISSACAERALALGWELALLTRGSSEKYPIPAGAEFLQGDMHGGPRALESLLQGRMFDVVVDWIAFCPEDVERDIALFRNRAHQFIFISSASAYQKPPAHYLITEETPLENPYWEYSRNKIACEQRLMREFRESRFPVTIVRPSLTYGPSQIPLIVGSWQHPYTVIDRMKRGKPVIVPGDGASLWVLTWNADFAVGFCGLMGKESAIGQAFHITSDEVLTWDQIYREAGRAAGTEAKIVHIPSDLIVAHEPAEEGTVWYSTTARLNPWCRNLPPRLPGPKESRARSPGTRRIRGAARSTTKPTESGIESWKRTPGLSRNRNLKKIRETLLPRSPAPASPGGARCAKNAKIII
jgi:nucleoside-diphosphate-sugar epimerase